MIVKLLTEHHLEFLSLKGGCRGSSESTHVKMSNCWKSHALAHIKSLERCEFRRCTKSGGTDQSEVLPDDGKGMEERVST